MTKEELLARVKASLENNPQFQKAKAYWDAKIAEQKAAETENK